MTILDGILLIAAAILEGSLSSELIGYESPFTNSWCLSERFVQDMLADNRIRHLNENFLRLSHALEFRNKPLVAVTTSTLVRPGGGRKWQLRNGFLEQLRPSPPTAIQPPCVVTKCGIAKYGPFLSIATRHQVVRDPLFIIP